MVCVDFPRGWGGGGGEKKTDSWIHKAFVVVRGGATEGQKVKGSGLRVAIKWIGRKGRTGGGR